MKNKLYFLTNYSVNCCFIDDLEISEKQAKEIIKTCRKEIEQELATSDDEMKNEIYNEQTDTTYIEESNTQKTQYRFYEGCNCIIIEKYEALNNNYFNDELEHKQIKKIIDTRILAQQVAQGRKIAEEMRQAK